MTIKLGYPIRLYRGHENNLPVLESGVLAYTFNDNNEDKIWLGTVSGINKDITSVVASSIPVATTTNNGLMSKEDKVKLDSIVPSTNNTYNAIITTLWDGATAPFTQRLIVSGIKATDNPIVFPKYSSDSATALLEYATWQKISNITTADNLITVHCFEEAPTTDLSIQLKVVD